MFNFPYILVKLYFKSVLYITCMYRNVATELLLKKISIVEPSLIAINYFDESFFRNYLRQISNLFEIDNPPKTKIIFTFPKNFEFQQRSKNFLKHLKDLSKLLVRQ